MRTLPRTPRSEILCRPPMHNAILPFADHTPHIRCIAQGTYRPADRDGDKIVADLHRAVGKGDERYCFESSSYLGRYFRRLLGHDPVGIPSAPVR